MSKIKWSLIQSASENASNEVRNLKLSVFPASNYYFFFDIQNIVVNNQNNWK